MVLGEACDTNSPFRISTCIRVSGGTWVSDAMHVPAVVLRVAALVLHATLCQASMALGMCANPSSCSASPFESHASIALVLR